MPVLIATPDEVPRMGWRQRARALACARAALAALEAAVGEIHAPDEARPKPVVVGRSGAPVPVRSQGKATPPPPTQRQLDEWWGAAVRAQARRALASLPPDPDAEWHRRALYFAVRPERLEA